MITYPTLRIPVLRGLVELKEAAARDGLDKVLGDDCPYDTDTRDVLRGLLEVREVVVEKVVEKIVKSDGVGRPKKGKLNSEGIQDVENELRQVLKDLREMGVGDDVSGKEKLDILKAKTTTIEKLVVLQSTIFDVKRISEFMRVVISVLDDVVTEDGRKLFLDRIEPYRE